MNQDADKTNFYLEPTDDPMQVRMVFNDGHVHEHIIVIETSLLKHFEHGATRRYELICESIDFVLNIEPRYCFPATFSLSQLIRHFPGLEKHLKHPLDSQENAPSNIPRND